MNYDLVMQLSQLQFTIYECLIILGQNLIKIWYYTSLNTIFGIIAYIYVHVQRFNEEGKNCSDAQPGRSQFLLAEVIIFWLCFHIASCPQLISYYNIMFFIKMMSKENLEDAVKKSESEEGEDKE